MTDWTDLGHELDMWCERGTPATMWWRDDDAIEPSQPLTRMLDLVNRYEASLALAVIPSLAKPALGELLEPGCGVVVLQHGFAHINYAPASHKKSELGDHRDREHVLADLSAGLEIIERFPASLPVLVPPWNRIDPGFLAPLPAMGYAALSTFKARQSLCIVPGLVSINTHADIINWHHGRGFIGTSAVLDQVIGHLRARRDAAVDPTEPTGLLTHHLVHDEECWRFMENFLIYLKDHMGAALINITEVLA